MRFENAYIPLDAAWSSPFVRWQGPAAEVSSLDLAAQVTARAMRERAIDGETVDELVLGLTVPQKQSFYGAPTLAARLGLGAVSRAADHAGVRDLGGLRARRGGRRRRHAARRRHRPHEQRAARRLPERAARRAARRRARTG